jgi:hypothetical protein
MPSTEIQVPSGAPASVQSGALQRQLEAERTMVRSIMVGILAAAPITIVLAIAMMGLAISDKEPWYVWIGLGAGIGAYAALFFGMFAGVALSTHRFDELDEDASHPGGASSGADPSNA